MNKNLLGDEIRVIRVRPQGETGLFLVDTVIIRPKDRFFQREVAGNFQAKLEVASLSAIWPRHSITWEYNGEDGQDLRPKQQKWTMRRGNESLDFMISGPALIFGMLESRRVGAQLSTAQVLASIYTPAR